MSDFFDELNDEMEAEAELMRVPAVTLRNTKPATDDTIINFGKWKGFPFLKDIPASYLLWWFNQNPTTYPEVLAYVASKKKELEEEAEVLSGHHQSGVDNRWDQDEDDYWGDRS